MNLSNPYTVVLGLNFLMGLVWLGALLAAISRYRAFKQQADLAWTGAYLLLAGVALGQAFVLWQSSQQPGSLAADPGLWYNLRFTALELIAAILALWAYTRRRAL